MTDTTGQAITLDYTLGIGIAVVLITGILIAGGSFVSDQRHTAARAELEVIGQQIAADVEAADRLVQSASDDPTVTVRRSLPSTVSGSTYDVEVVRAGDSYLRLTSTNPELTVRVEFGTVTPVAAGSLDGGPIRVVYTSAGDLALEDGDQS